MRDGTPYQRSGFPQRPAAAFGRQPGARLQPETQAEARAREAAVGAAHAAVSEMDLNFTSVTPLVYKYLVRINFADGTAVDVWVDPDVGRGRFFYDIGLEPLDV